MAGALYETGSFRGGIAGAEFGSLRMNGIRGASATHASLALAYDRLLSVPQERARTCAN